MPFGAISQPVGQVRLTNIAVVRLKAGGKRFEIACYKNKVVDWRARLETDVNAVLQAPTVFFNVSRGVVAGKADLERAFGSSEHLSCALRILDRGELEVSDKERAQAQAQLFRDVAQLVADMSVNPESQRPYPASIVERALHDVHFAVQPGKPAKAQALKAVERLKAAIPIARARIRVRIALPAAGAGAGAEGAAEFVAPASSSSAAAGATDAPGGGSTRKRLLAWLTGPMQADVDFLGGGAGGDGAGGGVRCR